MRSAFVARRFLVFPEDASVPHLRSALFVLGAGAGGSPDGQHGAGEVQAAAPFSFAAAEARRDGLFSTCCRTLSARPAPLISTRRVILQYIQLFHFPRFVCLKRSLRHTHSITWILTQFLALNLTPS